RDELARLRRVDLAELSTGQLVSRLSLADGWWRDAAHRLLLARRDRAAVEPLRAIVLDPQTPPATVVHALRLLEALDGLTDDLLRQALKHRAAPVREHALQLIEPRLAAESTWLEAVLPAADDGDAR